jgi:hypothetical protein
MTYFNVNKDFEGWLKGSPEYEIHIMGQSGASDSLTSYQCAGEHAGGAYAFGATYAIGRAACWYYGEILSGHLPNSDEVRHVLGGAFESARALWQPLSPKKTATPPSPNEAPK